MAQTAARLAAPIAEPAAPAPELSPAFRPEPVSAGATADDVGPALALQAYLREALEEEQRVQDRWSPRRTVAFLALTSGLLWAVMIGALAILS